jgi:hypothetical protein
MNWGLEDDMPTSQAPAHWSKDFVEHLRTVHFTLIAISAGLILLIFSSRQYNAVTALVQMEEILDLKKQWSIDWIKQHGNLLQEFVTPKAEIEEEYAVFDSDFRRAVPLPMAKQSGADFIFALKAHGHNEIIKGRLPKENWYHRTWLASDWSPVTFPRTLNEFDGWWAELGQTPPIYVPDSVSNPMNTGDGSAVILGVMSVDDMNRIEGTLVHTILPADLVITRPRAGSDRGFQPEGVIYSGIIQTGNKSETISTAISISITTFTTYHVTQNCVYSVFKNLLPGSFGRSFRDLSIAGRDEADLPLETIKDFLHEEAAKGPEVFEAFGMKFPAREVTFWGDILLVSVQLYFLVYLRQLFGKLKPDDPGWDVPWIGMDSSRLSNTIVFVSVTILPCLAAILLGWQATIRISSGYWERTESWFHPVHFLAWPWHWHYAVLLKILLLILAAILSGYLGILAWKYRPQIAPEPPTPPTCPAQLFE